MLYEGGYVTSLAKHTALQSQNTEYAYLTSKHILPSGFAKYVCHVLCGNHNTTSRPCRDTKHALSVQNQIRCHNVFRLSYLGFQWKKMIAEKSSLLRGNENYNSIRFSANKSNYTLVVLRAILLSQNSISQTQFPKVFNFPGICLLDLT